MGDMKGAESIGIWEGISMKESTETDFTMDKEHFLKKLQEKLMQDNLKLEKEMGKEFLRTGTE